MEAESGSGLDAATLRSCAENFVIIQTEPSKARRGFRSIAYALDRSGTPSNAIWRAGALRYAGVASVFLGDVEGALEDLNTALPLANGDTDPRLYSAIRSALGSALITASNPEAAITPLQEALTVIDRTPSRSDPEWPSRNIDRLKIVYNLASAYMELEKFDQAIALVDTYVSEASATPLRLNFEMMRAELAGRTNDPAGAVASYQAIYERLDELPTPAHRYTLAIGYGRALEEAGDYETMNNVATALRESMDTEPDVGSYYRQYADSLEADAAFALGDFPRAAAIYKQASRDVEAAFNARLAERAAELSNEVERARTDAEISRLAAANTVAVERLALQRRVAVLALLVIALAIALAAALMQRARQRERFRDALARSTAVTEERTRIAREVHDTLLQGLYSVTLNLQRGLEALTPGQRKQNSGVGLSEQDTGPVSLPDTVRTAITDALDVADDTIADSRKAILEYRGELDTAGGDAVGDHVIGSVAGGGAADGPQMLYPQLGEILETALRRAPAQRMYVEESVELTHRLPHAFAHDLGAIIEEALRNARKHRSGGEVELRARQDGGQLVLRVRNRAERFDPDAPHEGHFGLRGMSERAERLGAELALRHEKGWATVTLRLHLPGAAS